MIYTLTINPSVDYIMEVDTLAKGAMNRAKNTYLLPGGKGINVSNVLTNLGMENIAILAVAGFTGEQLLKMLSEKQMAYDVVQVAEGNTRINVKVLGEEETELNATGSALSGDELNALMRKLEKLQEQDILILSGSVPAGLGTDFYANIMKSIKNQKVPVVLDTIGESFLNALTYEPFLVKPNKEELESMFGVKTDTKATDSIAAKEELLQLAKKVQKMGAKNVLISLGGDGALLLCEDGKVILQKAPKGNVINTVGAGDSMVAGFVTGYVKTQDFSEALKMGIAAGSASAFSKNLATKEEIDALMKNL